ncbi:MAG: DNA alkylation repair protein [Muribaculum sp.]
MQEVKHRLYAMRNGAVADYMRRMGAPYRIIFGVNLPHLSEIASETAPSQELARQLWANSSTRESMLLAPMIFPREEMDINTAREWATSAPTAEVADILCMKLLKHMPFARVLADELIVSDDDMNRYTALRLMFNLLPEGKAEIKAYAIAELNRDTELTRSISRALIEEIEFLDEE